MNYTMAKTEKWLIAYNEESIGFSHLFYHKIWDQHGLGILAWLAERKSKRRLREAAQWISLIQ